MVQNEVLGAILGDLGDPLVSFRAKWGDFGGIGGDLGHPKGTWMGQLGPKWDQVGAKVVPK